MIAIIAFNYEFAGSVVNGPGMCLKNFCNFIDNEKIEVITELRSNKISAKSKSALDVIRASDLVIYWSGLTRQTNFLVEFAKKNKKKLIYGPNLIDTVRFNDEAELIEKAKPDLILLPNERLRFRVAHKHDFPLEKIRSFLIGPDLDLWSPLPERDGTILWKGNGRQPVKDLAFAKKIKVVSPRKFKFIGENGYDYRSHILNAKKSDFQIVTSWSETMGLAMLEGMAAGLPPVYHPKIYFHGENYSSGIMVSKTIEDFCEAIEELKSNPLMLKTLQIQTREFMLKRFSKKRLSEDFYEILSLI